MVKSCRLRENFACSDWILSLGEQLQSTATTNQAYIDWIIWKSIEVCHPMFHMLTQSITAWRVTFTLQRVSSPAATNWRFYLPILIVLMMTALVYHSATLINIYSIAFRRATVTTVTTMWQQMKINFQPSSLSTAINRRRSQSSPQCSNYNVHRHTNDLPLPSAAFFNFLFLTQPPSHFATNLLWARIHWRVKSN